LIVDTGFSDTWVVETGFVYTNLDTGTMTTETYCDFGQKSTCLAKLSVELIN